MENFYHAADIDWTRCPFETIRAGASNLPRCFKAFRAASLDSEILEKALAVKTSDVEMVQIEVPIGRMLRIFRSHPWAARESHTESEGPVDTLVHQLPEFFAEAEATCKGLLSKEWRRVVGAMPIALRDAQISRKAYLVQLGPVVDVNDKPRFHTHVDSKYSHLLTLPQSHLGTVYLNPEEIHQDRTIESARVNGSMLNLYFKTDRPTLWRAKGWAYNLMTASGVINGTRGTWHSPPWVNHWYEKGQTRRTMNLDFTPGW